MSETNAKLANMVAQANQLKAAVEQEEELIVKLVVALPGGKVLIKLPTARQWKYEYSKQGGRYGEYGTATARFIVLRVSSGAGKKTVDASAGPNSKFMTRTLSSFHTVLDRVGGFESLLKLIGEEIDEQVQTRNKEQDGKSAEKVDVMLGRVRDQQ